MKRLYLYICSICILIASCSKSDPADVIPNGITIRLGTQNNYKARIVDADNLASEQVINNISLFFTDPSSPTITHKFVFTGFSLSGDYQLITLPLEPADLLTKDIYAIANYDNATALEALSTLDNMRALFTPDVDKTNNLEAGKGFCMYGTLPEFDFTDESAYPATVPLIRTCAKYRVNLTFPEDPTLSITNSFLVQNAAKHTFVIKNSTSVLPLTDYFNFAAATPLVDNGTQNYTNIAYVYEATKPAVMTVYVNINNSDPQEFTADLPIPQRNYLYDIVVRVYEEEETVTRAGDTKPTSYCLKGVVRVFDETGDFIEEKEL